MDLHTQVKWTSAYHDLLGLQPALGWTTLEIIDALG